MKHGKSCTSILNIASIPIYNGFKLQKSDIEAGLLNLPNSGYSITSTFLMQFCANIAAKISD